MTVSKLRPIIATRVARRIAWALPLVCLGYGSPAAAQTDRPPSGKPAEPAAQPSPQAQAAPPSATSPRAAAGPADCGGRAAIYSVEKGPKIWVLRRGTLVQDNPLRPLSNDVATVLEIVVKGRLASAYGPDFQSMHQGGPPRSLEEANGHTVAWEGELGTPPDSIRVVSDDGAVVLGPLRFGGCEDAPKVAAPAAARKPEAGAGRRPTKPAPRELPPGLHIPQGLVPD